MQKQKSDATNNPETLRDLIEKKIALFYAFRSATALLKTAIENGDIQEMELMIGRRSDCIRQIDNLDREIPETKPHGLADRLTALVSDTKRLDSECAAAMKKKLESMGNELSVVDKEQKWIGNLQKKQESPRFLDCKI
ncbi:MAG: hypothetical protein ACE14T_11960 [Syntrophales bacterium]